MSQIDFKQPYNKAEFLKFIERDFLPEDFRIENEGMDFSSNYTQQATRLGTCESLQLEVIEIKHTSTHDARVGLSMEAFRMLLNRSTHNRALIIFVPQDKPSTYRFSLVTIDVSVDENKVRRSYSNPRRYSFVLGEDAKVRTPQEYLIRKGRVKDLEDLQKRFSVEVLTKEFYAELSDWYSWAISEVEFPNAPTDASKGQKIEHNSKNIIRLLTRLLFVWFLKQKHLIPNKLFDQDFIANELLIDFTPNKYEGFGFYKPADSKYYKAILQNLFFATLNCPISSENKMSRGFRTEGQHFDINSLMRYEKLFKNPQRFLDLVNKQVPFLNGGLFDCLDDKPNKVYIDGFSDNLIKPNILKVPDYLFFGEEKGKSIDLTWFYGGDKKKRNVNVRGLIDILNTYNFTIEENTPFDQEVSLDPELLGKVFENLLASYNPETKTTARKQTGSFYTPREIVQYMVDESLITHLKRTVGEDMENEYRKLMQYTDEELQLTTAQKQDIIRSLNSCKIIDPACGSGAFPVGVLQQMVHMLSQLDPENAYWHQIVKESTLDEMSKALDIQDNEAREEAINDIKRSFDKDVNRPDYARKLYLIENCIYGVDIQSIAVQISKLRFFISLVVEQKKTEDANDNFGIRPLPNLEAKFVAANTLIGLAKKEANLFDNPDIAKKEEELKQAKHKIYGAKTSKTKTKYKDLVATLRVEIADKLAELGAIGNDTARQLAQWDMFDQNASSPFFDPEWMFGVNNGFDIVIGNPPYLRIQGIRDTDPEFADKLVKHYKSATGSFDLYAIFTEKALQITNDCGIVNFIMPTKWTNAAFGKGLRNVIAMQSAAYKIINFGAYQVFNASTYTGLQWFRRQSESVFYTELNQNLETNEELGEYLSTLTSRDFARLPANKLNADAWVLTVGNTTTLLNKLDEHPRRMKDVFDRIFCGLQTSKDDVYFLYECTEDNDMITGRSKYLNRRITIERGLVKPLLKGEDVHRYDKISTDRYVIFPYKLENDKANLYSDSEMSSLYPKGYAYLKECEDVLRGREKGKLMNDEFWYRYIYPKNLVQFDNEKLVSPEISLGGNFAYDQFGEFYSTTKIYGYIKNENVKESYKFWLGLLNSRLFWFFLQNTGYVLRGGYFTFKTNYINPFPIPAEIPANVDNIVSNLVDMLTFLYEKENTDIFEHTSNVRIISHIEDVVNMIVYELYFSEHMKESQIDVIKDLLSYRFINTDTAKGVQDFYTWYQSSQNMVRQKLMLLETRSKDTLYFIHINATL